MSKSVLKWSNISVI